MVFNAPGRITKRKNDRETTIVSLHPPVPGLQVLSVCDDDGWLVGAVEPVRMMALVETCYYICDLDDVPRHPVQRQDYLRAQERSIEPVIYDGDNVFGLSPLSDLLSTDNEQLSVIKDDISWEELVREIISATHAFRWQREDPLLAAQRSPWA